MKTLGTRLSIIIGILIVVIGGSRIFDRSGPLESMITNQSGSLLDRYQTLPEEAPWIADSDIIRDYMAEGVTDHTARIIHTQQPLVSDFFWIRNIQQVGKFVLRDDVPGLFGMMDNLTALSPARSYPYVFTQYIGPQQPPQGEEATDIERTTRQQTIDLGEEGVRMTCDPAKVADIQALDDETFVAIIESRDERYDALAEPCTQYDLPHILGFNYFHYLKDLESAIAYYKVAAFHPDAPTVTAMMPALLRSRQGEHIISAQLWFDRAMALQSQGSTDTVIQEQYTRALQKAIYELQLHLLEQADVDNDTCIQDYDCLLRSGALRQTIQSLAQQCTDDATLTEQVQCVLLQQGLESQYIIPTGQLISPTATSLAPQWEYSDSRGGWRVK